MSCSPFEGCLSLHFDKEQALILMRLFKGGRLNGQEKRELIQLEDSLEEQLKDEIPEEPSINSKLFNNRSRW